MGKTSKTLRSLAAAAVTGVAAVSPAHAQHMSESASDFYRVTLELFARQEYKKTPTPEPFSQFLRGVFAQVASQSMDEQNALAMETPGLQAMRLKPEECDAKQVALDAQIDRFNVVYFYDMAVEAGVYSRPVLYTPRQVIQGQRIFKQYDAALNRACTRFTP